MISKKICKILVSMVMGILLSIIMICTALVKDDTIECKVIYNFFQQIEDAPHLYIEGNDKLYDITPHTPETDTYKTVWTWFEESYRIPSEVFPISRFSLELLQNEGEAEVLSIEFYNHGYQVAKFSAKEIYHLFTVDKAEIQVGNSAIKYKGYKEEIMLQGNALFLDILESSVYSNRTLYMNCIFWGTIMTVFVYYMMSRFSLNKQFKKEKKCKNKKELLFIIGLFLIFSLVCLMALFSKHYSHPDETVTRMAIDYYLAKWRAPDMESSWVAGTSSIYGLSRLAEKSIYYFLAGKIGWLFREFFGINTYYRVFNLVLLGCILFVCYKKRKEHNWMLVTLCMSPQLWYLFSYATSDAWDWFCGFIMLYMLLEYKKLLYHSKSVYRIAGVCICYSLVFAMLFLGKTNYYILLGIAFVDFLVEWFQQSKGKAKGLVLYFMILFMTFGIKLGVEHIPTIKQDFIYEGQKEIQNDIDVEYNYLEEYEEYLVSSLYEDGMSLHDMLWNYRNPPMLIMLFASATGCYMWMALYSGKIYTCFMGIVYLTMIIGMTYTVWNNRKENVSKNIKIAWSYLLCFLTIVITILYCWIVTYQPQGRYILVLWLIVGYIFSQCSKIYKNRAVQVAMLAGYIASCFSFAYYGLFAMCQQGYMLI